jgi:hypothetical protein
MTGDRLPPNSFRLYHRDTPATRCLYPAVANERQSRVQTAQWKIRVVTGPVSADAEELIDSWTQDDYSAGFGIKDANESPTRPASPSASSTAATPAICACPRRR